MLQRIADDPWPWFGLFFACFAVAAWYYRRSDSKPALVAAVLFLLAAVVPPLLSVWVDSPQKQVRRFVDGLAHSAESRNVDAIVNAISPKYDFGNYNFGRLSSVVRGEFQRFTPDSIRLSDVAVDVKGDAATVKFDGVLSGKYDGSGMVIQIPRYFVRFELKLRREGGTWKIHEIRRFEPVDGPAKEIPLDSHR